ncbi:hypothetical protein [Deinococcus altitudinis]|uniref:hypothetical protein n=1 Tax=Deinococcus altitudinis TaxID=468914 RepID=UPI003892637B
MRPEPPHASSVAQTIRPTPSSALAPPHIRQGSNVVQGQRFRVFQPFQLIVEVHFSVGQAGVARTLFIIVERLAGAVAADNLPMGVNHDRAHGGTAFLDRVASQTQHLFEKGSFPFFAEWSGPG